MLRGVKVAFQDPELARIRTGNARSLSLPVAVIKAARRKLDAIEAALDERNLRNWKSLHYEQLQGNRKGQHSIRLNDQWRLVFRLDNTTTPPTVTVIAIEDYH